MMKTLPWDDAIARVEKGWIRDSFEDEEGNVCLLGSLGSPRPMLPFWSDDQLVMIFCLSSVIRNRYEDRYANIDRDDEGTVVYFNDFIAENKKEVLSVLREAKERWPIIPS